MNHQELDLMFLIMDLKRFALDNQQKTKALMSYRDLFLPNISNKRIYQIVSQMIEINGRVNNNIKSVATLKKICDV